MKRVLVVGVDTIVGGNVALALAKHHRVAGLTKAEIPGIAGVETRLGIPETSEGIRRELAIASPDLVVVCGPASESLWSSADGKTIDVDGLKANRLWAQELAGTETGLIVISSDAVFHGPWMFHEESCSGVCHSAQASAIREMESQVQRACPSALILRTHAFGWSPDPVVGWLENLLETIEAETPLRIPSANYATPIAAVRLAELLIAAWDRKLEGIYHVAGSERVNFRHFAHRLAQEFQLPRPQFRQAAEDVSPHAFGQGETSLCSNRFRRAVGTSLPMLAESLHRLRDQTETGELELLKSEEFALASRAA